MSQTPNILKPCRKRPFTLLEQELMRKLKPQDGEVSIYRITYNYRKWLEPCPEDGDGTYSVFINNPDTMIILNKKLADSLSKSIAIDVFGEILEDSILFYTPKLEVSLINFTKNSMHPHCYKYNVEIYKDEVLNYLGKKLVKTKQGFKWIKVSKSKEVQIKYID